MKRNLIKTIMPFLLIVIFPFTPHASASSLTPQEKHGKEIYSRGTSPSGREIKAFVGIASVEAPGAAMPCVNCHGYDGLGRPEAGISPSNITWKELTKSYGIRHSSGREHPAYAEGSLKKAITKGLDPAGNRLNSAMPNYSMADDDLDALIAYLKHLGTEIDPGLTETRIRIGTLLPVEGPLKEMGQAMRGTIQAFFDDINQKGGIYSRRLELVVGDFGEPAWTGEQVRRFSREKDLFALVSTFTPSLDREIPFIVEEEAIPLVGPFTMFPQASLALNRYLFYLFSGIGEQARALMEFAFAHIKLGNPRTVLLHASREELTEIIDALEQHVKEKGWKRVSRMEYPPQGFDAEKVMKTLKREEVDVVLFLGGEFEVRALFKEGDRLKWAPYLLIPGVPAGKAISSLPPGFRNQVYVAYPTLPDDRKERGMRDFITLSKKYDLPPVHLAARMSAYCAVQIILEGLRRSGRELSRERLISSLEKVYEFDTGLTPLITYGPNRHIGAMGAYIVTVDPDKVGTKDFISSRKWVTVD